MRKFPPGGIYRIEWLTNRKVSSFPVIVPGRRADACGPKPSDNGKYRAAWAGRRDRVDWERMSGFAGRNGGYHGGAPLLPIGKTVRQCEREVCDGLSISQIITHFRLR